MATIVVAHGDPSARDQLSEWLQAEGHAVLICGGPEPPDFSCPVLHYCGCSECEQGDAMIYDPHLVVQRNLPSSERIICRLREWYPEKPIVVIDRGNLPAGIVRLLDEDSGVSLLTDVTQEALAEALREALEAARAVF